MRNILRFLNTLIFGFCVFILTLQAHTPNHNTEVGGISIDCPSPININTDATTCYASNVDLGAPVVTTNCGIRSVENDAPSEFPVGETIVTWTAIDNDENVGICTQTVTVTDNVPPSFDCPTVYNFNVNEGQCGATISLGNFAATDNCDGVNTIQTSALGSGSFFPVGTTIVSYEATDAANLTTQCSFTVNVRDNEKPILNCTPITITLPTSGSYILSPADKSAMTNGSTDNCTAANELIVIAEQTSFDCNHIGINNVSVQVMDAHNNTSTACTIPITINAPTGQMTLSKTNATVTETDNGMINITFTVNRDETTCPAQVNYTTVDGTATAADNDYVPQSGIINFDAGVSSQTITIQVISDNLVEEDETFSMQFSNATNNLVIVHNQIEINILTDDFANNALDFDGINDEIIIDNFIMPLSFTMEFWLFYSGHQNQTEAVVAYQDNYFFLGFENGNFRLFGTTVGLDGIYTPNTWNHIALTYNGNNQFIELFIDGNFVDSQQKSGYGPFNTNTNNRLGVGSGLPGANCTIDDFRLWNGVLTQEQITNNKDCKLNGQEDDLVIYYNFDNAIPNGDNTGNNMIQNIADSKYHGQLNSFSLVGMSSNFIKVAPTLAEFCPGSLDIEWLDFSIKALNNHQKNKQEIQLNWQTSEEIQTSYYEIERSMNGVHFYSIGKIIANNNYNYQFIDMNPVEGDNFYRIREINNDGSFSFSSIRLIQLKDPHAINIYPNPTSDLVYIESAEPIKKVSVLDAIGQTIHFVDPINSTVNLSSLPLGIYFIKIETATNFSIERVVKQGTP